MALLSDDDVFGANPSKELMSDDDVFGTSVSKPQNKGIIGDTVTDLKRGVEQLQVGRNVVDNENTCRHGAVLTSGNAERSPGTG